MNPASSSQPASIETRVNDLVAQMTLEEQIGQMMNDAPRIERLNMPKYNWWNEALHGPATLGCIPG